MAGDDAATRSVWQPVAPPVDPPGSPLVWLLLAYLYYYFAVEFGVVVEAALLAVPLYVLLGRYLAGYAETRLQNESLPASERTLVAGTAGAVVLLSVGTAGVYVLDFRGLGAELPSVALSATTTILGLGTLCCWVCFDGLLARDWMCNEGVERPLAWEYAAVLPLFEFALLSQVSALRAGPTLLALPLFGSLVAGRYLVGRTDVGVLPTGTSVLDGFEPDDVPFETPGDGDGRRVLKRLADSWAVTDDVAVAPAAGVATERVRVDRHRRFETSERTVTREEPNHGFGDGGLRAAYDVPDASDRDAVVPERHRRSQIAFPKADTERTELCADCEGTGTEACGCGDGLVTCTNCRGNGLNRAAPTVCSRCGGSGEHVCHTCNGSGQVACDRCDGYATVRKLEVVRRYYTPVTERRAATEWAPESLVTAADGRAPAASDGPDSRAVADGGADVEYDSETRTVTVTAVRYEYDGVEHVCLATDDGTVVAPSAPRSRVRRALPALVLVVVTGASVALGTLTGWF